MASTGNAHLLQLPSALPALSRRIVIVKTEWNGEIVDALEFGARSILQPYNVFDIETVVVPGAIEIPFAIQALHRSTQAANAYIAFACIIRGDTPHFDYVCQSITQGITQLNLQLSAPVVYGVLTVNTELQAQERIGGVHGHKGEEAALTALKMMALADRLL